MGGAELGSYDSQWDSILACYGSGFSAMSKKLILSLPLMRWTDVNRRCSWLNF